jgi:two-component system response regulator (stage 0 sporulation protein F)
VRMSLATSPLPWSSPARVLLAEDDPSMRELLATTLREDGLEVIEARDGSALLDRLAEALAADGDLSGYDVIVSDIRMPGHSALDILAGVRHALRRIPVILITAFGDRVTHERAMRLGASAVFDKPFDLDDLRTAVHHELQQRWSKPV